MEAKYVAPLAALAAAALAAPLPAAEPATVQQQFDQASEALFAERWQEALAGFDALEKRLARNPASLAVVRVRKGEALLRLNRLAEAKQALELGLPALPEGDASLRDDRASALLALGAIAERALDYRLANRHYRAAQASADTPVLQGRAFDGVIDTGTFVDPATALADADRGLAWYAAQKGLPKEVQGDLLALKGRVLLNLGRFDEAHSLLRDGMKKLGGLTTKVTQSDVIARSDLAIAALLAGKEAQAREYLAYTGAGRIAEQLIPGMEMNVPKCGENGLSPSDVGVVEFAIAEDGTVARVSPVYASGGGEKSAGLRAGGGGLVLVRRGRAEDPGLLPRPHQG
jgi:tetratricopeptide (TPR) repeat protein